MNNQNMKIKNKDNRKIVQTKKYIIKNTKFSVLKFKIILNNIRKKNFFNVFGILVSSKYYDRICKFLYKWLECSLKHFLSINRITFNLQNLKTIYLENIYSTKGQTQKSRVSFRGKGRVNFIKKNKSHLFCIISLKE